MTAFYLTLSGVIYMVAIWLVAPRQVSVKQFFSGRSLKDAEPTVLLLAASAAISWIFAKSIVNAASLTHSFGLWGGFGYSVYYLSFIVVAVTVYYLRVRGGYTSLPNFIQTRYGRVCMRLFLVAIAIRLFNEVWSNTKVVGLFFGEEGASGYWAAVIIFTLFTVAYTWRSGLRGSLLTDGVQMLLASVLLAIILAVIYQPLAAGGVPSTQDQIAGGITFALLAFVQIASYGFHDPVLTDRAFISKPKAMLKAFTIAALVGGGFIVLFGLTGLYARTIGHSGGNIIASVTSSLSLPLLIVFNIMMLTSAGSTLDSTFSSTAKMTALDLKENGGKNSEDIQQKHLTLGRKAIIAVAVLGNLPLLTLYMGDGVGPLIIKATTISGTMIMGLAPVFLLCFIRTAGRVSFHLSFWAGLALGTALAAGVVPDYFAIGAGKYALSLGVNIYGLIACSVLYVMAAYLFPAKPTDKKE